MITQMNVRGLLFDPYNNAYIVILRDEENSDMLPIWVGKSEASAISFALENVAPPRPMTHDLMKSILDNVDAKILSAVVTDLKDNTYYAKIHLLYGDSEYSIDSRPSDAIAWLYVPKPRFLPERKSFKNKVPRNWSGGSKI